MNFKQVLPVLLVILSACGNGPGYPYQNTRLDFETRAEDLVSRMTLEEKVSQVSHYAEPVEHLGIPRYNWWNECLHGVARAGKATVFPQAIGMAATFDRDMLQRMARITSTEGRAKYNDFQARGKQGMYQGLTFWSPNINIFRVPRWGRGHETYGEDPYLTGELAVQFIRGLQGDDPRYLKTIATAKHYAVHSGPEHLRHEFDARVSERDFRDTYLPAFKKAVEDAGVYSVMCAYNRYMGEACCGSIPLQEEILRGELGFKGYIVSDCGAIRDFHSGHKLVEGPGEAAALGVMSGTDLNCGYQYPHLVDAVEKGLLDESQLNVVVKRLMLARMKLGMFDPPDMVPWSGLSLDEVASEEHRQVALDMARKSMVLLKNKGSLPLKKEISKLAVIGPNAHNVDVQYGNYNGTPLAAVSVVDGIRNKLGKDTELRYALGTPHHEGLPYLLTVPEGVFFRDKAQKKDGLSVRYYSNLHWQGKPVSESSEAVVDHYWWDGEPPVEGLEDDNYSVEWEGYLVPRVSGNHAIGINGKYFKFVLEGDTLITNNNIHRPNKTYRDIQLEAGKSYKVKILMQDRHNDAMLTIHWQEPGINPERKAMELARWADHVVLVMGLTVRLEGEEMKGLNLEGFRGGDRTSMDLPENQRRLIRQMVATGKPVTLVLMSGSALSLNWSQAHVPAILQAWYGGECAGEAVADVLFGDYNPAGRLPMTYYKSMDDLPPFEDYSMEGRTYRYFDGEVLYPFGHGLSYSTFLYSDMVLEKKEIARADSLMASITVSNTGDLDGEEVVQLYLAKDSSAYLRPRLELKGFERVFIPAGKSVVVSLPIRSDELEIFDEKAGAYVVERGTYNIYMGPSSDKKKLLTGRMEIR